MTSPHLVKTSKCRENCFINKYFTSTYLFLIFIFVSILVHEYQFGPFWPIFGLMTSHQGVRTSIFWDNSFKDENLISNFYLLLTFTFLSPLVHEIQVWALLDLILGWWRHHVSQNCSILRKWSLKQNPHSSVPSNIDFDLSITLDTWYTTLGSFYPIWR